MSKLIGVFEAFNGLDSIEELIKTCELTMKDATKALEKDKDSSELKAIYEAAQHDKKLLLEYHERLKREYSELLEKVKADPEFIAELESTTKVPKEFKKALESLKQELLSQKAYEKPEE